LEKIYTPVDVSTDGTVHTYTLGEPVMIRPGESISLVPGLFR